MNYQKYKNLYEKVYSIQLEEEKIYEKLYLELYQLKYNDFLNNLASENNMNKMIDSLNILLPLSYQDLHKTVIKMIHLNKVDFVQYMFDHFDIDYNFINVNNNKLLIHYIMENGYKNIFHKMIESNKIDYEKNGFLLLSKSILCYGMCDMDIYYFNEIFKIENIVKHLKNEENYTTIYQTLRSLKESSYKFEIYEKVISNIYFTFSDLLLQHMLFLNHNDDIQEIILNMLFNKYEKNVVYQYEKNVVYQYDIDVPLSSMIILTCTSFSNNNINTLYEFLKTIDDSMKIEIFSQYEMINNIYNTKKSLYKSMNNENSYQYKREKDSENYNKIIMIIDELEKLLNIKINGEVVCKNSYTCNICLDEDSSERTYQKCNMCKNVFHKSCLQDYLESCNETPKCCYCQNYTGFSFIIE
jgi:hypothetical protein